LQLFPLSHAALALPSKTPCQIKLRISTTSKNDRFPSQWEQLSLDPRCSEMCSKVLRIKQLWSIASHRTFPPVRPMASKFGGVQPVQYPRAFTMAWTGGVMEQGHRAVLNSRLHERERDYGMGF